MLASACDDVKKISNGDAGDSVRVGIVFVIAPVKKELDDKSVKELIEKLDGADSDFSSHIYLDCFRDQTGFGKYDKTYYPGISIFGRRI